MTAPASRPSRMRMLIRAFDLDRSLEFYRDLLGLPLLDSHAGDEGAIHILDAGGGRIVLAGKPAGESARGGWDFVMPVAKYDLVLEVEDALAACDALRGKGIEPAVPPAASGPGSRTFTVLDPDDTPVVFVQRVEG